MNQNPFKYFSRPHCLTDAVIYIVEGFELGGKSCESQFAAQMVDLMSGGPRYIHMLASCVFEATEGSVNKNCISTGLKLLIEIETVYCKAVFSSFTISQKQVMKALAKEPASSVYGIQYMARHKFTSVSGTQSVLPQSEVDFHAA